MIKPKTTSIGFSEAMANTVGRVLSAISNIYSIEIDGKVLRCRIKGKILEPESVETEQKVLPSYNPIAVGDWVYVERDSHSETEGLISGRRERDSSLARYNKKRRSPQVLAANVDTLVCLTTPKNPPFRPRFVDRMLVSAQIGGVDPVIFVNKMDLGIDTEVAERVDDYTAIGYSVILGSALTGEGLESLKNVLKGKTVVFAGQSGVGKSFLLNQLDKNLNLKVGDLSRKWDRGGHTTKHAVMINLPSLEAQVIDTPGIRELDVYGIPAQDLAFYFPEFVEPAAECSYSSCHHVDEPGCVVKKAVAGGSIHSDRYESYLRLHQRIADFESERYQEDG